MITIPNDVFITYIAHLNKTGVPATSHAEYKKWLRYYLDFFARGGDADRAWREAASSAACAAGAAARGEDRGNDNCPCGSGKKHKKF